MATNAGFDALRTNSRRRKREETAGNAGIHAAAAPERSIRLLAEERGSRVREVLGALKPRDAQLLLLRANGLAYRELAATLGIEPGSVGTMLARAEAGFRTQVSRALRRTGMTQCWSEGALRAYLDRELPTGEIQRAAAHLRECTVCDGLCKELAARAARVAALLDLLPELE